MDSSQSISSAYGYLCKQDASVSQQAVNIGIGTANSIATAALAAAKIPSLTMTGSTNQERVESFCNITSKYLATMDVSITQSSIVSNDKLQSLNQCMEIESKGLRIVRQSMSETNLVVQLEKDPAFNTTITSVSTDAHVKCTGSDLGDRNIADNKPLGKINFDRAFTIRCARAPIKPGEILFEGADVSINTTVTPYNIRWPQSEKLPVRDAQKIAGQIKNLNLQISSLSTRLIREERLTKLVQRGTTTFGSADNIYRERINFPRPFPSTPQVFTSIQGNKDDVFSIQIYELSSTGFTFGLYRVNGSRWGGKQTVDWLATLE
ncbi:H-type lectin domain-containing protein [Allostella humosa]|nr:H-type lectin domain-containing protein [Stella humosa]